MAPAFLKALDTGLRQQELRRFVRSVGVIEALLLLVVGLFLALAPQSVSGRPSVIAAMLLFAVVSVLFRVRSLFPRLTRLKLAAESWVMTAFITLVLWFTGGDASPLLGLYLLPITLCALTLGRWATFLQLGAICGCYVLLAAAPPEAHGWDLSDIASALARLVPLLLVAYLTSTLAADIFAARRRIENLAQTDPLTGLLNLRVFSDLFKRAHAEAEAEQQPYTVMMLDMDNLKSINDSFGHEAGNSAIVLVANCIRRTVRTSDIAARFGGDEFVVFLPGADAQSGAAISQRLRNLVYNTTLNLGARIIRCNVSIGLASFPKDGRNGQELLTLADQRMYRDKELRRAPERRSEAGG